MCFACEGQYIPELGGYIPYIPDRKEIQMSDASTELARMQDEETPEESPNETINDIEFVGFKHYEGKKVAWFTVGPKAFPTKPVNSWLIMKLAKAQNNQDEQLAMAASYDILNRMIPVKYREEFDSHMTEYEYEEDDVWTELTHVMNKWGNLDDNSVDPLASKKQSPGSPTPQSELPTFKEVSLHTGKVEERPLTPEEMDQYNQQIAAISSADLDKLAK